VTVTRNGETAAIPINGPPTIHQIVADEKTGSGRIDVGLSAGLQAYSLTYG
jgi:hypothetical protein